MSLKPTEISIFQLFYYIKVGRYMYLPTLKLDIDVLLFLNTGCRGHITDIYVTDYRKGEP